MAFPLPRVHFLRSNLHCLTYSYRAGFLQERFQIGFNRAVFTVLVQSLLAEDILPVAVVADIRKKLLFCFLAFPLQNIEHFACLAHFSTSLSFLGPCSASNALWHFQLQKMQMWP